MRKKRITLTSLEERINQMAAQMATKDELAKLFGKVDALTDFVRNAFQQVNARLDDHARQLKDLHNRVDTLHGLMENLVVRVERLQQEYTMITAGLKRLEVRFDETEAARLKERIDALEKRVTALESVQTNCGISSSGRFAGQIHHAGEPTFAGEG
jgi:chromosome segregation ATPase